MFISSDFLFPVSCWGGPNPDAGRQLSCLHMQFDINAMPGRANTGRRPLAYWRWPVAKGLQPGIINVP